MKKLIYTICFLFIVYFVIGQVNPNYHLVKGHYRNGVWVEPHYRTNPNNTVNDNYSTQGNINPHTGVLGWLPRDNGEFSTPHSFKHYPLTPTKIEVVSIPEPKESYTDYFFNTNDLKTKKSFNTIKEGKYFKQGYGKSSYIVQSLNL